MSTQKRLQSIDPTAIFHPIEHAFLADWLGIERTECAREIDLAADIRPYGYAFEDEEGETTSDGIIHLQEPEYGDFDLPAAINNAVARLVLSDIQERLPQWAVSYSPGEWHSTRGYEKRRRQPVSLLPRFLFMLNWADSGPGMSWPESFHVGFLPYYDVHIVTGSVDSTDAYGYTDRVLGSFTPDVPLLEGCRKVIIADWEKQAGWGQLEWAYLFSTGIVSEERAREWAKDVWGVGEDEYQDDEEVVG